MSEAMSECDVPPAKRTKVDSGMGRNRKEDIEEAGQVAELEKAKKQVDLSDDPKYSNFVTPEELEKLKEFKVLDEVKSNDEDSNDESDSSDGKSEVPDEEIEKMLEADLPDGFKGAPQPKEKPYVYIQKVVLEEKGVNHWEVLPLDWIVVRHYSGMPVYVHRTTRVCTLSKPYFLGQGNTRRHDIPISAIPCLSYRRALEEERKQQEIDRKIAEQIKNGTWVNTSNQKSTEISAAANNNGTSANHEAEANPNNEKTQDKSCIPESENHAQAETNLNDDKTLDKTSTVLTEKVIEIAESPKINEIEISNCKAEDPTIIDKLEAKSSHKQDNSNDEPKADENIITESSKVVGFNQEKEEAKVSPKCPFLSRNKVLNTEDKTENVYPVTGKTVNDVEMEEPPMDKDTESNSTQEVNIGNGSENNEVGNKPSDDIEIPKYRQPVVLPGGIVMPAPKVETINNSWTTQHLSHEQINDYCKKLFKFKTVNIMHFNRWADRRKYKKARKTLQYPTLPDGTKLITIPARPNGQDNGGKPTKRDWVMNMDGRSYLSVFHEYVRRALQQQPVYEFVQLENAATPYQATVYIGGMQYGVGHGSSKRQAKSAAARASIHILIPEMKDELDALATSEPDFSFFDYVGIEDPRISEFCAATCEPSPHAILRTCLLRNFGASDRHIQTEMKKLEFQKIELTMKVGKHSATVVCKNKKTAKQRASQAILQALHPHVRSWGSLLRLYGSRSVKSFKEKKLEEQQITLLQDKARHNQPNKAVLDKLRRDMLRLKEKDASCVPIGTLLLEDDLPTHSGSNLNNVDL